MSVSIGKDARKQRFGRTMNRLIPAKTKELTFSLIRIVCLARLPTICDRVMETCLKTPSV